MRVSESVMPESLELLAQEVHFAYAGRQVLHGVTLKVRPGEVVSLLGANGSGKTTLLRLLLGLSKPRSGLVSLNGRPLMRYPRRELAQYLAYVPQTHVTPFPYTVREIVVLGRLPHTGLVRSATRRDCEVAMQMLERLGIADLAERPYTEISGGERQLALIARALAQGARILIMDEPVSGLDYGNQLRFLALLRGLAAEGYAIVKATHHPEQTLLASTRVALLCDGAIVLDGTPAEVVTPSTIQRIYHIEVSAFHAPNGEATAFYPSGTNQMHPHTLCYPDSRPASSAPARHVSSHSVRARTVPVRETTADGG
jgi:iron complex transport system ATP-binding protein